MNIKTSVTYNLFKPIKKECHQVLELYVNVFLMLSYITIHSLLVLS